MELTWLGQASLLIKTDGFSIMVDPYLTDSIYDRLGEGYKRLIPLRSEYLNEKPDVILISHDHTDHLDVGSLKALLDGRNHVEVLAAENAWSKVRNEVGGNHNFVQMKPGIEWTTHGIRIKAVPAYHSDSTAVGFLISGEGQIIYITGDTLYNADILKAIDVPVDIMITVVNGMGNNMNGTDAARLAERINPCIAIPVHWGLFAKYADTADEFVKASSELKVKTRVLSIYETIDTNALLKEGRP